MVCVADPFFPTDDGQFKTRLHVKRTGIHDVYCFSFLQTFPRQHRPPTDAVERLTSENTSKSRELPGGLNLTTRAGSRRLPSLDADRQ